MLGSQHREETALREVIVGDQYQRKQLNRRIGNDGGDFSGPDRVANPLGPQMPGIRYQLKKIDLAEAASRGEESVEIEFGLRFAINTVGFGIADQFATPGLEAYKRRCDYVVVRLAGNPQSVGELRD